MLITYTGRKTRENFTTPVNYLSMNQDGDQFLATISLRERVWWRNLRNRTPMIVRFRGKDHPAAAEVIEDDTGVAENLGTYLRLRPDLAKYLKVRLDATGQPKDEDIVNAAKTRVIIKTQLV